MAHSGAPHRSTDALSNGRFRDRNGITLCNECHPRVRTELNGRSDLTLPLGSEQGDDKNKRRLCSGFCAMLKFGVVLTRASPTILAIRSHAEFLCFALGYNELYERVTGGEMSRMRFAHEIWRRMPEA